MIYTKLVNNLKLADDSSTAEFDLRLGTRRLAVHIKYLLGDANMSYEFPLLK